ncbi:hypothetical protein IA57_06570 [Mangrovimonas yunxiaonensis]|uniref:Uncharacterized protein n=1 Tax=Mangrovimonas yunxiaonensis TaxID=1197477 RepID=A0A084TLA3_9FLAO|nr:hypothetical protein [Mangrovimonas yunxiaonensis]KFB01489.1 hypothetical protein IA57_06570 [Mangrovimonas yunxiaonensis]GGH36364.1 hypothetical protein GCM10011364_03610 [Mangrovimonas yunxiaonensis]
MSKLFSITFSLLILVQSFNISLEDFSKLGNLFEHAQYHKKTYGDSFYQFLQEHYGNTEIAHNHDDTNNHDNLPFGHDSQCCHHFSNPFTIQANHFNISTATFLKIPFNFFYKESSSLFEKPSVFQPPQLA